jgi:iron complex outermembrane receptor protein
MFFGSITDGFKSGGWNARGTSPDTIQPFGPEEVTSFEVGMRADFLDNRLRVNLTAFQADVDDFQIPSAFNTPAGQIIFITRNFAGLDNTGLEAEIIAAPTENLTLFANIGFQDAEYVDLDPSIVTQQAACQAQLAEGGAAPSCGTGIVTRLGGIALPTRTPDYTAAIGGNYLFNFSNGYRLIPSITIRLQDDFVVGTNRGPEDISKGETFVRAGITLEDPTDTWSVTLDCQNCTDKEQVVSALAGFEYIDDPRQWDLRFRYRF